MAASTSASGSITAPLVIVILSICLGSNFQFYSNSVINNIAGICQKWMNDSYHDHHGSYIRGEEAMDLLWSFSSAALQLGCLFGTFFTRFLADRFGRRIALMIMSVISMIGALLNGFSKLADSFEMFILGRFLMGINLGCGIALVSIFITEIAPVRYRGACGSAQQMLVGGGNALSFILTLSQLLGTENLWPIAVSVVPFVSSAIQFLILLFFAYESPRYLILSANGKDEEGLKALRFYQGKNGAEIRLQAIKEEKRILEQKNGREKFRFVDVFKKVESRKPLMIALLIIFGCQMTGVGAVLAYSKTMFMQAGLDSLTAQYASMGIGFCNFLSPILTMFLVERLGRKAMLLAGLGVCDLALIALTICVFGSNQHDWPGAALGAVPCLYVFQIGFSLSNSILLIAPAELFPQKVRASAMTVVFCFSWFLQSVVVLVYLPFSKWVGVSYSYLPLIFCVTLAIVLLAIFMPETKGKTVEQVAAIFRKRSIFDSSAAADKILVVKF